MGASITAPLGLVPVTFRFCTETLRNLGMSLSLTPCSSQSASAEQSRTCIVAHKSGVEPSKGCAAARPGSDRSATVVQAGKSFITNLPSIDCVTAPLHASTERSVVQVELPGLLRLRRGNLLL